jgi:hypothetical protein
MEDTEVANKHFGVERLEAGDDKRLVRWGVEMSAINHTLVMCIYLPTRATF